MAQRGRRLKLTPELQKNICDALAVGMTDATGCAHVGISKPTFYRWLSTGEGAERGKYREFRDAVVRARQMAGAAATVALRSHFAQDWRACLAYLERRDRENWGREPDVQVIDSGRVEVVSTPTIPPEEWAAEAEIIQKYREDRARRLEAEAKQREAAGGS